MTMKQTLLLSLLVCALCTPVRAQRQDVTGVDSLLITPEHEIYLGKALELCQTRAKVQALTAAFGQNISMINILREMEYRGKTTEFFYSNALMETNGRWERDTRKPTYSVTYSDYMGGSLLIRCQVWGQAAKVVRYEPYVTYKVMNGKRQKAEEFPIGDGEMERFYLDFHADADGVLAVYLQGMQNTQMLPMFNDINKKDGLPVRADKDYHLFTDDNPLCLMRDQDMEAFQLVIVFTRNKKFHPRIERQGEQLYELDTQEFEKWLADVYRKDEEMVIRRANIFLVSPEK